MIAGGVGNAIEWFDFGVYAYLAPVIADIFFDPLDRATGLLATFGIFAASFFMRPLGGIAAGHFGDRVGRKPVLVATVLLMSVATFGIGVLPMFTTVGVLAPLLLLVLRMLQGLAAGGEVVGAASFVVEHAPRASRGRYGGIGGVGVLAGFVVASAVVTALTTVLGDDAMAQWGWRVPFLLAAPLGIVAWTMRTRLIETPVFRALAESAEIVRAPLREAVRTNGRAILVFAGIEVGSVVAHGMLLTYIPTFLRSVGGLDSRAALLSNTVAVVTFTALFPLSGAVSDRWGRGRMIRWGLAMGAVLALPVFALLASGSFLGALAGQLLLLVPLFFLAAPLYVALAEYFPAHIRYSSGGISYNLAQALFGGTTGFVSVWLVHTTGSPWAPAGYLAVTAAVSFGVAVAAYRPADPAGARDT